MQKSHVHHQSSACGASVHERHACKSPGDSQGCFSGACVFREERRGQNYLGEAPFILGNWLLVRQRFTGIRGRGGGKGRKGGGFDLREFQKQSQPNRIPTVNILYALVTLQHISHNLDKTNSVP